jgi:YVTN family beta-propeller protein
LILIVASMVAGSAEGATLLVANKSDHTIDLIDLETGKSRATLPTGRAPHEVSVSPDGSKAVVANYGDRSSPGSSLTVIDIPTAEVLATIDLGRHQRPHGVAWFTQGRAAVTTEGSAHLLVVDPGEGTILQEIETGQSISHMVAVSSGGRRAFVANIGSGTTTVIDLEQGRKLKDIATGEGAEGVAMSPDGSEVWVTNRAAGTLSVIDPETLEIVETVPCPGFPIRIAATPNGQRMLVSAAESGEVVLVDATEKKELLRRSLDLNNAPDASRRLFGDRFGASPVPVGLVVEPSGERAYVAATQADVVVVVDPETLDVLDLVQAGREPDGMAYTAAKVSPTEAAE